MRLPHAAPNAFGLIVCLLGFVLAAAPARAQDEPMTPEEAALVDRPISSVEIEGLDRVSRQTVLNNIRTQPGNPYDARTRALDLQSLQRLGLFETVTMFGTLQPDGTVKVTIEVEEQPLIADVQVVGNSVISDQEILAAIPVRPLVPRDEYVIQEAQRRIKNLYRERGYYRAEVEVEEQEVDGGSILIFRIIEGPRVKIRAIEFRFINDQRSFTDAQLRSQIDTETAFFIFRKGNIDEQMITRDVSSLVSFYMDRGYLDIRVDREIQLSPDSREAKVVFIIDEGPVYTMRNITAVGNTVFTAEQLAALAAIKSGDVYSQDRIRKSVRAISDAYGLLGYADDQPVYRPVNVRAVELRNPDGRTVDLRLEIDEGERYKAGVTRVAGNFLTKQEVILRHVDVRPNRPLNLLEIREAEEDLRGTQLFGDVRITPQPPDPLDPAYRDILIEVKERNTGSFNFGAAIGSDSGFFGDISLNQRNFDLADWPESIEEFTKGRAFRGAGQRFSLALQPGDEVSRFSLSITEPYLFETPNSITASGLYREWQFSDYDEERLNGTLTLSRRLGELWSVGLNTRFERVELTAIAPFAPTEVFDAEGPDSITSLGVRLTRSTVGSRIRPGRGTVLELAVDRVGALGGDFDFTTASLDYTLFLTLAEDFLGRKTILRLNTRAAYIFEDDEAPVYEQFYLGGRSFRGFDFRTVSPKGIRADNGEPSDEPVGGEWLFFLGAQYEFPIFEEVFNGVFFVDSGTVSDDLGFSDYRVSVGTGIRMYIDAFGPVPLAFDLAVPIVDEPTDEEQIFSFSAEFPF